MLAAAGVLLGAALMYGLRASITGGDEVRARELVISVLRTVPRSFLVLLTDETIVVSHQDRSSWLMGTRKGQSAIEVRIHWGVDLEKIVRSDIIVDGSRVRVRLPDPEVFDVVPDLDSWRYTGKRSGLHVIADSVRGTSLEHELLRDVQRTVGPSRPGWREPPKQDLLDRINHQTARLFEDAGLDVRFE